MLKQSTARNRMIWMASSTDHITGASGLTLTITASKDGGSFGSISPTVTDLGNGWYALALTTSHTNTLGDLALHITGGVGADPTDLVDQVVELLPGDPVTLTSAYDNAKIDLWNVTLPSTYTGQKAGFLLWKTANRPNP